MRPITKVLLVLSVVALAVGVVWFVSQRWGGGKTETVVAKTPPVVKPSEPPAYNDPLEAWKRWRDRLPGADGAAPPVADNRGRRTDIRSSSVHEGTAVAHRSEVAVAGADPPGPTGPVLRPTGVPGTVVTGAWKPRDPSSGGGNVYTIAQGDTLYGIAVKHYGSASGAEIIEAANPGLNPKALRVGDKIRLPEKPPAAEKLPAPGAASDATPPAAAAGKVYVVQKNDTLIGISKRIYGDASMYLKIYEANKDILSSRNAALHVGQKLRLPEK
ncbi:MAG: LysM peptidoglycan-binding domain-containing protein [Planctomycetota bacterium]|nr:LysM peptidoglycan-binding domain-containing protein [Planctomycetota bacterium]